MQNKSKWAFDIKKSPFSLSRYLRVINCSNGWKQISFVLNIFYSKYFPWSMCFQCFLLIWMPEKYWGFFIRHCELASFFNLGHPNPSWKSWQAKKKKLFHFNFLHCSLKRRGGGNFMLIHYLHVKFKKMFEEGQFNGKYRSKLIPKSCQ